LYNSINSKSLDVDASELFDDVVLDEGTEILTGEVLGEGILEQFFKNCSLTVAQQSQMVS
jgi:hypothetical protein